MIPPQVRVLLRVPARRSRGEDLPRRLRRGGDWSIGCLLRSLCPPYGILGACRRDYRWYCRVRTALGAPACAFAFFEGLRCLLRLSNPGGRSTRRSTGLVLLYSHMIPIPRPPLSPLLVPEESPSVSRVCTSTTCRCQRDALGSMSTTSHQRERVAPPRQDSRCRTTRTR